MNENARPMFRQHTAGKIFDFAEGDSLKTARAFKAKAKAAYAAEQVKEAQLAHLHIPTTSRITHQSVMLIGTAQTQPYSGLGGLLRRVMRPPALQQGPSA